ncbi:LysM domain-containing protein [Agromyces sp. LHK192]|uniref:LysM peptidoglycan-binding domain-containing protein n=1 Tax=Agromyces sp. LHK192 TaxID=2498704 RepID=UPI000FDB188D|nr:LysM domain-containing protein [Agromyces sp. LHK192]
MYDAEAVGGGSRPERRGSVLRRLLAVPTAIIGTVALALGSAAPAEADTTQAPKRQPKPKATARTAAPAASPAQAGATPIAPTEYVVAAGDTVSGIAERYGIPTAEVLARNGLGWSTLIFPGQRLILAAAPAEPASAPAPPAPAPVELGISRYTVVRGDTLIGIAETHSVSLEDLLSVNGLSRSSLIFPGQPLVLPGAPAASAEAPPVPPTPVTDSAAPVEVALVASVSMPLTHETRANARVIVDVGRAVGAPDRAIVIALAAAAQESGLRNLHHGDQDSLGLFQQRPSQGWGTPEQILDPVRAATAFYGGEANPNPGLTAGLLDVPGWESLSLTQAAQAVQRSAHPDHYAKWEQQAAAWLSELG